MAVKAMKILKWNFPSIFRSLMVVLPVPFLKFTDLFT